MDCLPKSLSPASIKQTCLPLFTVKSHFPWSEDFTYWPVWMNRGRLQDNTTYQLPLKGNYFPSDSHSLHGSGFSNTPTSAMDGPCSHGFARMSVWHFIRRVQSPFGTASDIVSHQKATPKGPPSRSFRPSLKVPPMHADWKPLLFKRAGKIWKEGLYVPELPNQTLRSGSSREWPRSTRCFPGTMSAREGELRAQLSGQRLLQLSQPAQPTANMYLGSLVLPAQRRSLSLQQSLE